MLKKIAITISSHNLLYIVVISQGKSLNILKLMYAKSKSFKVIFHQSNFITNKKIQISLES